MRNSLVSIAESVFSCVHPSSLKGFPSHAPNTSSTLSTGRPINTARRPPEGEYALDAAI